MTFLTNRDGQKKAIDNRKVAHEVKDCDRCNAVDCKTLSLTKTEIKMMMGRLTAHIGLHILGYSQCPIIPPYEVKTLEVANPSPLCETFFHPPCLNSFNYIVRIRVKIKNSFRTNTFSIFRKFN